MTPISIAGNSCHPPTISSKLQIPSQLFGAKVVIIDGNLPGSLQQQLARILFPPFSFLMIFAAVQ
jgi:hypothetical protein